MAILGNQQGVLQQVPIFNYEKTAETAKTINVRCDFALDTVFSGNLSQERRQGIFQSIRSIYFNCENCANDVTFTCVDTGQVLTFEAGKSGYLPLLVSQGMSFRFVGTAPDVAIFNLLNVDMPPAIWPDASGTPGEIEFSASPRLLGRYSPGAGPGEEIQLGAGLSFVGDTLTMGAGGPYVLKAGDTMTGPLIIDSGTGALPAPIAGALIETSAPDAIAPMYMFESFANAGTINFRRANGTRAAPTAVQNTNALGAIQARGYGATGYAASTRSGLFFRATENWTDAAQGAQVTVTVTPNTTVSPFTSWRFGDDGSIFADAATGGKQGNGTVNATDYFNDGVNINTIYAGLTSANVFTAAQTITVTGAVQALELVSTDAGAGSGPNLHLFRNSASPAASDALGSIKMIGKNSAAANIEYTVFSSSILDATAGSEDSTFEVYTYVAGAINRRLRVSAGVFTQSATGGDQGVNTINSGSYFTNGNLSIDTNALLKRRAFTFGTLPAAASSQDGMAVITDGAAAPAWLAAAAGGGAVRTPVISNGAAWNNG